MNTDPLWIWIWIRIHNLYKISNVDTSTSQQDPDDRRSPSSQPDPDPGIPPRHCDPSLNIQRHFHAALAWRKGPLLRMRGAPAPAR